MCDTIRLLGCFDRPAKSCSTCFTGQDLLYTDMPISEVGLILQLTAVTKINRVIESCLYCRLRSSYVSTFPPRREAGQRHNIYKKEDCILCGDVLMYYILISCV